MIAVLVASVRHKKPTRYRFECADNTTHKPIIGKWTLDKLQARVERDEHNAKRHNVS